MVAKALADEAYADQAPMVAELQAGGLSLRQITNQLDRVLKRARVKV